MSRIIQILIALLLPPLSVFLQRGLGTSFLLNLVLTLLGGIPGSVHALMVLMGGSDRAR